MDKSLIIKRLKRAKKFTTDKELADFLGISKSTLSNWGKRNSLDFELVFSKCKHINLDWLLTGDGEMLKTENNKDSLTAGGVPYWNLPVSAGKSVTDIIGGFTPDGYIQGLPGADIAENILPVSGTSMEPEISTGALIGVRKINNWETLNTERIYLIITQEDRMIKRIEHDEDDDTILWCVSPNYSRFKIYKADIIEIQRVCFVYNPK